jgi:Do/DeqQ family serine protease
MVGRSRAIAATPVAWMLPLTALARLRQAVRESSLLLSGGTAILPKTPRLGIGLAPEPQYVVESRGKLRGAPDEVNRRPAVPAQAPELAAFSADGGIANHTFGPLLVQCGELVAQVGTCPRRARRPSSPPDRTTAATDPMRPAPTLLVLAAAAMFGGFTATFVRDAVQSPAQAMEPGAAPVPVMAALPAAVDGQALPSLAPMLRRVTPSVVSVQAAQRRQVSPFGSDPLFGRMFPELSQERIARSLGSGVVVDARNGYVLTNHHVIENADEVSVTLADGRTLKAEFIGSDPDTDVALMRIPAEGLTAIPLAEGGQLAVGDFVVVVGNPFGVGQTVTSGIVSAVGRSNVPGVGFQNFIQTDASINPGNSGGALVNLRGELVGINTASFNPRGSAAGNIGLGFAIPVDLARNIMQQLASTGTVRRGTLGVETQAVDARLAAGLGLQEARGVVVTRLHGDSAAAAAGLRTGDVIVSANGQRMDDPVSLRNFQGLQSLDAPVTLEVLRDGEPLSITARLRALPREGASFDERLGGATLADLPEAVRRQNPNARGVLVERVERDSRAWRNGLREGDYIFGANSGEFRDLASFRDTLAGRPGQLVLRISRGGRAGNLIMQ